jgi:hypothetical protein
MISQSDFLSRVRSLTGSGDAAPVSPLAPLSPDEAGRVSGGWDTGWDPYYDYLDNGSYDLFNDWTQPFDEGYYDWFDNTPIEV